MKKLAKEIPIFEDHSGFLSKIKVIQETECWEWNGEVNSAGYGIYNLGKERFRSHRVSYSIFNNRLSPYLVIDHKCRNRKCCNPDHLREVTKYINNIENSISPLALNKEKDHCKNGHELTVENTYIRPRNEKGRDCRTCRSIRNKKRYL